MKSGDPSSIHSTKLFPDPHRCGTHAHTGTHTLPNFPTHLPCFPLLHTLCRACTKNNTSQVQLSSTLRGQKWTNLERSLGCHQKEPWEIKSPLSTADFTPHNHGAPPALPTSAANCPTPWQPCQAHCPSSTRYRNNADNVTRTCSFVSVALSSVLPCRHGECSGAAAT